MTTELIQGGPGGEVVMARLSDALITRALRHHLETVEEAGWLRGLQDPYVAKALAAIHTDLAAPWTVLALARVAGLFRSTFAARFCARVGHSPMEYVNRCRMGRAMMLLRTENATVGSIAARVGYGSESAFANAFVRHTGRPPGAYRRDAQIRSGPPT